MSMNMAPNGCEALELREDILSEQRQRFTKKLQLPEVNWWEDALQQVAQQPDANTLIRLSSQCKRHLVEQDTADNVTWTKTQKARVLLLAEALKHQAPAERSPLLRQFFAWGDDQEKIAILKALDWFDATGQCLDLAQQAGRTHNSQVFAALALDNPFPSSHYGERAFHQLVLKALGMGLDVQRLLGLPERRSSGFNQLALDAMEEQLAAERPVSTGLVHVIAFALLTGPQHQRLAQLIQAQRLPPEWAEHFR
ncbi:EboA domain-containing protein [Pseudomonas sp. NPDC089734]|uniref:EboA domain-containing protein n=1 Tax=Pseudomonas sp. NPDC089734 TaxID=3364469 RepID=UPI00381EA4EC